ncbi:hypothetical protein C7K08_13685 [Synechococcus lacustris str. Tous]|uniref:Uncharacterized protein n=1 Tax=Synechococcus lacustris str. Tous TaxID=1910958 RepID=A0A2P7EAV2_9SYNE|nr:hypothetical protein C7K08_13685 [Synechococcus lacustris str. Tous]
MAESALVRIFGAFVSDRLPRKQPVTIWPPFSQKRLLHWAKQRSQRLSDLQEVGELGSNTPRRPKIFECLTGFLAACDQLPRAFCRYFSRLTRF